MPRSSFQVTVLRTIISKIVQQYQHSQRKTTYSIEKAQLVEAKTVFEGTDYKLSLLFPNDYPFKRPPKVKFDTSCFHPNVDVYGNICLDILQDKWSSAYDVRTMLLSIQSLHGGALWGNHEEYRKMVEKLYKPSAA